MGTQMEFLLDDDQTIALPEITLPTVQAIEAHPPVQDATPDAVPIPIGQMTPEQVEDSLFHANLETLACPECKEVSTFKSIVSNRKSYCYKCHYRPSINVLLHYNELADKKKRRRTTPRAPPPPPANANANADDSSLLERISALEKEIVDLNKRISDLESNIK
jgi:hypothetical protein